MTIEPDVASDLTFADGIESVTFRQAGDPTPMTIGQALRRGEQSRDRAATLGQQTETEAVWHIPVSLLGVEPRLGAELIDSAGVRWVVVAVQRQAFGKRWRLTTRSTSLADGVNQRITIQQATWKAGRSGDVQATWHDWRCGIVARIQARQTSVGVENARQEDRTLFTVLIEEDVRLGSEHRIVDAQGVVYRIERVEHAGRLGEPTVVHVCRIDAPDNGPVS